MSTTENLIQRATASTPLALAPLNATSLRDQAYSLIKAAIADTDIYNPNQELRLDERQLITALGVSRPPIREALSLLEQEGFVRPIPRRGIYIVRKSKHTKNNHHNNTQTNKKTTRNQKHHVRAARRATISHSDRAARSIIDHLK